MENDGDSDDEPLFPSDSDDSDDEPIIPWDDDDSDEEQTIPLDERIALVRENDPSTTEFELAEDDEENGTENQMRSLLHALRHNTHVQKLDLFYTPHGPRGYVCQLLLPALLRENSSIPYVRFPFNMTNEEFLPSAEILCNRSNATLKTLDMDGCDISGREGGEIIARLMRNNRHVTTINLCENNSLGPAGVTWIAAALGDDGCVLKTLNLDHCLIGDEGMEKLCVALEKNNSLENTNVQENEITLNGYRALARSLPRMSGLKSIHFQWEPLQISAAVFQAMMEGIKKNSILRIIADDDPHGCLSLEQTIQWGRCSGYVCLRNILECLVRDPARIAAREGRIAPMPVPMGHLLKWCRRNITESVRDSLIYHILRSRIDDIAELTIAQRMRRHAEAQSKGHDTNRKKLVAGRTR